MKPFTFSKYLQQITFIKLYSNHLSNLKEIVFKELFLFFKASRGNPVLKTGCYRENEHEISA